MPRLALLAGAPLPVARWSCRARIFGILALGLAWLALQGSPLSAQTSDAYRPVEPIPLPLDRNGVWTLHFAFTPPRILQVTTAKGPQYVWYMVYQVWNKSDTPQLFIPEFELVTKDGQRQIFLDEPYPGIAEQIRKIEDPTGALQLKTTVGMTKTKIPVTKEDSIPRAVYGVAVWVDAPVKAAESNAFSIYITGLSNGLAVEEQADGTTIIRRKTLQLDFIRPTDNSRPMTNDIRPSENNGRGPASWIYRVMPKAPDAAPAAKP